MANPKTQPTRFRLRRPSELWLVLALALGLRTFFAFYTAGFVHPDEIERFFEPIAWMKGWSGRLVPDLQLGMESTLSLEAHVKLVGFLEAIGARTPTLQAALLRALYGALSLIQVYAAWRFVAARAGHSARGIALGSALAVAVWPGLVLGSVHLLPASLIASLFALALLLAFPPKSAVPDLLIEEQDADSSFRRKAALIASGAIFGAMFFANYTSFALMLGTTIGIALARASSRAERAKRVAIFGSAYALTLVAGALLEAGGSAGVYSALEPERRTYFLSPLVRTIQSHWFAAKLDFAHGWKGAPSGIGAFFGFAPLAGILAGLALPFSDKRLIPAVALPFILQCAVPHPHLTHAQAIVSYAWALIPLGFSGLAGLSLRPALKLAIVAAFVVGGLASMRDFRHRLHRGAVEIEIFAAIGRELRSDALKAKVGKLPLFIEGDPSTLPGAFFLRHRGRVCYEFSGRREGDCPALSRQSMRLVPSGKLAETQLGPILVKRKRKRETLGTFGNWVLVRDEQ